jgi:hypothetical protein
MRIVLHSFGVVAAGLLCGCTTTVTPGHGPATVYYVSPPAQFSARLPTAVGGEAYQDYRGQSVANAPTPILDGTCADAQAMAGGGKIGEEKLPWNAVIIPNAGERPVESINSMSSPPCCYCN